MIVQLPNGKTAEFPDDMPQEQIAAELAKAFPEPESGAKAKMRTFLREGLPYAGGLIGAALPYVATGGGAAVAGPLPGIAGAGLGAAGARAGGQSLEKWLLGPAPGERPTTLGEDALDVARTGVSSAGGEVVGPVIIRGATAVLAPGAKWVAGKGKAFLDFAKQHDIPASPDVIAPGSWFARWNTRIAENTPGASWVVQAQRKKIGERLLDMRNTVIEDVIGLPRAGQKAILSEAKNAAYGAIDEAVGNTSLTGKMPRFDAPRTLAYLREHGTAALPKSKLTKDAALRVVKDAAENNDSVAWDGLRDLRSKIWGNAANKSAFGKLTPEDVGIRQGLVDAIEADFKAIGDSVDADLPALTKHAKETFLTFKDAEKADYIERLLAQATETSPVDGQTVFLPAKFKQVLLKNNNTLEKQFAYDPERLKMLRNWADMMEMAGIDMGKAMKRSAQGGTRTIAEVAALGGGAAAKSIPMVDANPVASTVLLVAVPAFSGFESAVAYSMMRPKGVVKKWLTEGFQHPELMKAVEKDGTKGLLLWMNEKDQERRRK